jgi:quercetin dioxygenase-like cupin family protein
MPSYRLYADDRGQTHIEAMDLFGLPFENGPGAFKGVGGSILGDASRVMMMRFEVGAHPEFHRAVPSFAVLLSGALAVSSTAGDEIELHPGDAIRVETTGRGGWRLGNRGDEDALLALSQMPPPGSAADAS